MSIMPPPSGPRAALADLAAFLRQRSREQVIGAMLAILSTIIIVILFLVDPQINTAPPEQIVFVESYKPGRTDAEIKADQLKDQKARAEAKEARKREFQKIENTFGM
ncbi:MAG: hypothetical protein ABR588_05825 [Sphingomicrobium sp.]|nr:hypothetical protein [Sphingomonadales bacterium]